MRFSYTLSVEVFSNQLALSALPSLPTDVFAQLERCYPYYSTPRATATETCDSFSDSATASSNEWSVVSDPRFTVITIESYSLVRRDDEQKMLASKDSLERSAKHSSFLAPIGKFIPQSDGKSEFMSGILHLYRDAKELDMLSKQSAISLVDEDDGRQRDCASASRECEQEREEVTKNTADGHILCVLAVPSYMSVSDYLSFVGCFQEHISHFRIIRDHLPSRYIVIMRFRDSTNANLFYDQYNERQFSSLKPELCHVAQIRSIVFKSTSLPPFAFPHDVWLPEIHHARGTVLANNSNAAVYSASIPITIPSLSSTLITGNGTQPETSHTSPRMKFNTSNNCSEVLVPSMTISPTESSPLYELPTCPVCLERMDSTTSGILTTLCQHTFHCGCLSRWGQSESTCPVCRHNQRQTWVRRNADNLDVIEQTDSEPNECTICGTSENLWICLLCGHIGCGRYEGAHAHQHFVDTSHLYSLEIETQRVWDYAGDGYVHRLVQNKADGKLVEIPSPYDREFRTNEKLESITKEYTYLLTTQLDSQRQYYESQLSYMSTQIDAVRTICTQSSTQLNELLAARTVWERKQIELQRAIKHETGEREAAERKTEKCTQLMRKLQKEHKDESSMSKGLLERTYYLKLQLGERDATIADLQEQLRDVMFFLDAQRKIEQSELREEIRDGTIKIQSGNNSKNGGNGSGGDHHAKEGRRKR